MRIAKTLEMSLARYGALFLTAISSRSADLAHKVHWTLCL
ncbi:hypothetical protein HMPREF1572_01115 [Gardnerella vaginalis JCP7275]|nr:hypothetical protein HMPREF1572_01115 [Gardnerella vaginalis JCP7275]